MRGFPQCPDSKRPAPQRRPRCRAACETRKQVFESPHKIARARRRRKSRCNSGKFLIISLQLGGAKADFQNAWRHYGDKWFAKRSFSRLFFRVTPALATSAAAGSRTIRLSAGYDNVLRILANAGRNNYSTLPVNVGCNNFSKMRVGARCDNCRAGARGFRCGRIASVASAQTTGARRVHQRRHQKRKSPAVPGSSTNLIFPQVHFASFAI